MTVRAKFRCHSIQCADNDVYRTVHLSAVIDDTPENKTWSQLTPAGDIRMVISNPAAFDQFEEGREYFADFHLVSSDELPAAE